MPGWPNGFLTRNAPHSRAHDRSVNRGIRGVSGGRIPLGHPVRPRPVPWVRVAAISDSSFSSLWPHLKRANSPSSYLFLSLWGHSYFDVRNDGGGYVEKNIRILLTNSTDRLREMGTEG